MKIGILQTGHAPDELLESFKDYDVMFQNLLGGNGFEFETYSVVDGVFPPGADACDGWLITGSRHGAYEDHPWIPPLENLIRDIHARKLPLVGICFGHQIIAQALGGKVVKYDGGWAVGRVEYDMGGEKRFVNAWHQDQVIDLPPGARVVGGNDFCKHAILAYDDTIWTMQPHPEYGADFIEGLIDTRGKGVVPEDQLNKAREELRKGPTDSPAIAREMAEFFKKERA